MPSPVGHALAGLVAGRLVAGRAASGPGRLAWLFAALAAAPDLDLLVGRHSAESHSVGAVVLVALVAYAVVPKGGLRLAVACGAAWGSHLLLDWLGTDRSAPIGIMALWPVSDAYVQSTLHVFAPISRRYWLPEEFVRGNAMALLREALILGPVALLVLRRREAPDARQARSA